jgi:hypothetical protein
MTSLQAVVPEDVRAVLHHECATCPSSKRLWQLIRKATATKCSWKIDMSFAFFDQLVTRPSARSPEAYRIRTGESVCELPDWICVTTWPEVGACAVSSGSSTQTPVRRSRGGAGLSLALPMAIPICGVAGAAASLTPSPTTANPSADLQLLDDLGLKGR